jgi:hypothetical protein
LGAYWHILVALKIWFSFLRKKGNKKRIPVKQGGDKKGKKKTKEAQLINYESQVSMAGLRFQQLHWCEMKQIVFASILTLLCVVVEIWFSFLKKIEQKNIPLWGKNKEKTKKANWLIYF